jgi:peptidyl-tRNA hydrolase, PTH1 family
MAWLQKRPQLSDTLQFYTTSLSKTKLVVGLGNPGREYDDTRHNIGFACVDRLAAQFSEFEPWTNRKDLKCHLTTGRLGETRVIIIKPTTFMNVSGEAVQAVAAFYKLSPANTIIVHDELDIAFGQVRLRTGGSSAGHNGLKSVIQHFGEQFGRVRIGVGPKQPAAIDSADFVLQKFTAEQQAQLPNLYQEITAILTEYIYGEQLPAETRTFLV